MRDSPSPEKQPACELDIAERWRLMLEPRERENIFLSRSSYQNNVEAENNLLALVWCEPGRSILALLLSAVALPTAFSTSLTGLDYGSTINLCDSPDSCMFKRPRLFSTTLHTHTHTVAYPANSGTVC
jgi:hypothetical protein